MKIRHPTCMSSPHRKSEFSYLPKLYKICDHKVVNNNNIVNHLFFNVFLFFYVTRKVITWRESKRHLSELWWVKRIVCINVFCHNAYLEVQVSYILDLFCCSLSIVANNCMFKTKQPLIMATPWVPNQGEGLIWSGA